VNPHRRAGKEESDEREIVPLPVVFEIAKAVPVRYRALVLLATFADMRWGELVGLRRENIDLEACEIRIKETLAQPDKGGLRTDTPKSQAGKRTVAFPAEIAPERRWTGFLPCFLQPAGLSLPRHRRSLGIQPGVEIIEVLG
jgi:integrase